tara:strand:- start:13862 stop:14167 length:306 start_codon:yes stop_codon:yes gene_type:complete
MTRFTKNLKEDLKEASGKELRKAALENFTYGFLGSILIVFIATGVDIAVLIGYLLYYFFVGKVINRPKYVTSLGKFIMFPIPASLGAFTGYKLAYLLTELI